ncbi:hypothetical protein ACQJBY_001135 [Aegilops geniculata]
MDWDILPRRAAWWPRCGSPMLCSDGPTLLDSFRWLSLIRFPVVACVEPWVRLSFSLSSPLLLCLPIECLMKCMCADTCSTVQPTSPVAGASSSRPSCCLPNVLLLAASGCTISSVAASFDSSRKPQHKIVPPLAPGYSSCCNLFP